MNREEFLKMMIESKFGNVKAFSEVVGVPYTTIRTMLANGLGKAGVDNVLKICRGLGIDPKQLSENFEVDDIWHTCNVCNTQAYTRIQTATNQRLQTYLNYKNIRIHMLSAPFLLLFKSMQIKKAQSD